MLKILLIEDEALAAKRLAQLILELEPEAEIHGPLDTITSAIIHLNSSSVYDLIFLDIQLADGKSFAIFDHCKVSTPVIFTTAYDEYALQAFDLNSIDYLLKPIKREKLSQSMDKFRNLKKYFGEDDSNSKLYEMLQGLKVNPTRIYKDRFLISKGDAMILVKTEDVACFYAEDKEVFLCTNENKRYIIQQSIDELSRKLDPKQFFRVNRPYILSINAIKKVHNHFNFQLKVELKVDPKTEIMVSRSRSAAFKAWMNGEEV